jgi:hypothetical protein
MFEEWKGMFLAKINLFLVWPRLLFSYVVEISI